MEYRVHVLFVSRRPHGLMVGWGRGAGRGGIIINVVVTLKKNMSCYNCF